MRFHTHKTSICICIILFALAAMTPQAGAQRRRGASATPGEYISPQSAHPEAHWPGLELLDDAMRMAAEQAPADLGQPKLSRAPGFTGESPAGAREEYNFNDGWMFHPIDAESGEFQSPRKVKIPDRWEGSDTDPRSYHSGWYVKKVDLPVVAGKRLVLKMEYVPLFSVMYVNGIECGRHMGSSSAFEFDLTPAAREGENLLAIYVHDEKAAVDARAAYNQLGLARRTQRIPVRGGIWGGMILQSRNDVFVNDVFVKTSTRKQQMELVCEISNASDKPSQAEITFSLVEWPEGKPVDLPIPSQSLKLDAATTQTLTVTVPWDDPKLWSTEHPNLYVLHASCNGDTLSTRFGFREFWAEGRNFMLNGKPIRLRGESAFNHGVVWPDLYTADMFDRVHNREMMLLFKKLFGANSARIHATIRAGALYHGADEAGFLIINQSGLWTQMGRSYAAGGDVFLNNTRREFREWVRRDRNSPSVVIWDVENELIRDDKEKPLKPLVLKLDEFVRAHDDTRLIGHSGAGWYDPEQDLIHEHMQEHYARIIDEWNKRGKAPLIIGEFWVGGRGSFRLPTSMELKDRIDSFVEESSIYRTNMLEMRYHGVSGIMPFTLWSMTFPVNQWTYDEHGMKYSVHSQKIVDNIRHALQPVTVFIWPPANAAEPGKPLRREIVVCNDSEDTREMVVEWGFEGQPLTSRTVTLDPAAQSRLPLDDAMPAEGGLLVARLTQGNDLLATDSLHIQPVAPAALQTPQLKRKVMVYEGGTTGTVDKLRALGIDAQATTTVPSDPQDTIFVVARNASDVALGGQAPAIHNYLENGGRLLCMAQEKWMGWSPLKLKFWSAVLQVPPELSEFGWPEGSKDLVYSRYAGIYAPSHPVFDGINTTDLRWWHPFDGRLSDDAIARPAAIGSVARGAWRVLAGAERYENASLVEARIGRGLLFFCQAHVLEESNNPQPRAILMNTLRYLDGETWAASEGTVKLAADDMGLVAAFTGLTSETLTGASPAKGAVMFTGDGVAIEEIDKWTEAGGTVCVLSAETASRIPGFAVRKRVAEEEFIASRGQEHPLFWGVSMINFSPPDTCVVGEITQHPDNAKILLNGLRGRKGQVRVGDASFGAREAASPQASGPVAVSVPWRNGELIVTTIEPWEGRTPQHRELFMLLLANAGASLQPDRAAVDEARVLKTIPLKIDGRLDDWTNDMEDRNVNPYVHADPILIPFTNAIAGQVSTDADLSAIAYLLWDNQSLNIAGAVFGRSAPGATVEIRLGQKVLRIEKPGQEVTATLEGAEGLTVAGGEIEDAAEFTDARNLSFTYLNPFLATLSQTKASGRTFELRIPWNDLGGRPAAETMKIMIRVIQKEKTLQTPLSADENNEQTWMNIKLGN